MSSRTRVHAPCWLPVSCWMTIPWACVLFAPLSPPLCLPRVHPLLLCLQSSGTGIGRDVRAPFIEIELDLCGREVKFVPSLGFTGDNKGLSDRVMSWVESMLTVGSLFPRVDSAEGDYSRELQVCVLCGVGGWWVVTVW